MPPAYHKPKVKTVTIYDPKGKACQESVPNARDLINNCGYSWEPGVKSTPASNAPLKIRSRNTPSKSAAQEILDSKGGTNDPTGSASPAPEPDEEEAPDEEPVEQAELNEEE